MENTSAQCKTIENLQKTYTKKQLILEENMKEMGDAYSHLTKTAQMDTV